MIVVCAWCRSVLSRDDAGPAIVSHGVCPKCRGGLDAEFRELEERLRSDELHANTLAGRCVHGTPPGDECLGCMAES